MTGATLADDLWTSVVRGLRAAPRVLLLGVLRAYQLVISPMTGPTCRYYPSCSQYAVVAVRRHGAVRGSWLAIRRLGRCHPWAPGGVDDVPPGPDEPLTRSAGRAEPPSRSTTR